MKRFLIVVAAALACWRRLDILVNTPGAERQRAHSEGAPRVLGDGPAMHLDQAAMKSAAIPAAKQAGVNMS